MTFRNICVYGAGALGGNFAAMIAKNLGDAVKVTVIARGAQLAAIKAKGLTIEKAGVETFTASVDATDDPFSLPPQDLVITGLKGHQLADAAKGIAALLHEKTRVINILNGIPWWYFHGDNNSRFADLQLPELDPEGELWSLVGPQRVIGCVAYQGAEVVEPGTTRLSGNGRFFLGEPSGELSDDLNDISDLLTSAGFTIFPTARIRDEIWLKLTSNAAFNPISALTRSRMDAIMVNPHTAAQVRNVMGETKNVGEAFGATFEKSLDELVGRPGGYDPVRTSMLQDFLAGKQLEVMPLTGMVVTLGKLAGVPTPTCETILALTLQLDQENRNGQG
jgi:2-dehydropantoate 2-reductase